MLEYHVYFVAETSVRAEPISSRAETGRAPSWLQLRTFWEILKYLILGKVTQILTRGNGTAMQFQSAIPQGK